MTANMATVINREISSKLGKHLQQLRRYDYEKLFSHIIIIDLLPLTWQHCHYDKQWGPYYHIQNALCRNSKEAFH